MYQIQPDSNAAHRERGSALLLALILIVVLTFVGFGLLTRSLLVTQIAGSERWSTKAFYAADAGMAAAAARLRVRDTLAFNFNVEDLRGYSSSLGKKDEIGVAVTELTNVGNPQPVVGSQVGGGQGGSSEPLYVMFYRGTSTARQVLTRSERIVTATMGLGPVPLSIPES